MAGCWVDTTLTRLAHGFQLVALLRCQDRFYLLACGTDQLALLSTTNISCQGRIRLNCL